VEGLRAHLGETLDRLCAHLRPWLGDPASTQASTATAAPALDPAALKVVVERWARLLAECDARTSDDLEREGDELRALFGGADGFTRFARLVTAYEFEDALAALRRAAGEKGI
jgi:two-component system sensor histidine kinase/response regulator